MPKFKAEMELMEFDKDGFDKAIIEFLQAQMKLAAREFAKAALARIPVRTGFVAGAFGTLTQLVGSSARLNPIVSFVRRMISASSRFLRSESTSAARFNRPEYYYPPGGGRILKTTTSGQQFATPTDKIITVEEGVVTFTYNVDISYFSLNDQYGGHAPTAPWGAFEAAEEAFREYMETSAVPNLPKMEDFIKLKTVRVG